VVLTYDTDGNGNPEDYVVGFGLPDVDAAVKIGDAARRVSCAKSTAAGVCGLGLLQQGIDPGRIALAGEPAGGDLAVATLLTLKAAGRPMPSCAFLMSPYADLTLSGETMAAKAETPTFSKMLRGCHSTVRGLREQPAADLPIERPLLHP
jgi:hypothetical protein